MIHPPAYPRTFAVAPQYTPDDVYLGDRSIQKMIEFFAAKGMRVLKDEDRSEKWYDDWLQYQAEHRLHASVLSPKRYSSLGFEFDLLKLTRFLEVFAFCSPAHGYSLQVSFLGLFPILMGSQAELKAEAVAALEAGGVFALGVSERDHGSDLLGNEFSLKEIGPGQFIANGTKHYIGNANCATMISILARKIEPRPGAESARRAPFTMFALRPGTASGFRNVEKIRTIGVRQAFVGGFEVAEQQVRQADVFAEGRSAWDAVFGTVTLGKFFLGFGSIGMCEHALAEAASHLGRRLLYGKPAIQMPHLRTAMSQAYARLLGMKLYAYRALDYVHAASADDRRYVLYCAVQKAKVSTEGVKVMALLSECMGARGFESDTFFETALRDIQLIPSLEGSTHINLSQAAQFIPRYFAGCHGALASPPSLLTSHAPAAENPYLMEARTGGFNRIVFPGPLESFRPVAHIPNVRLFAKQVKAFGLLVRRASSSQAMLADEEGALLMGKCIAAIAYAQLIAENAVLTHVPPGIVDAVFQLLVNDLSALALSMAGFPLCRTPERRGLEKMMIVPKNATEGWNAISAACTEMVR